MSRAVCIALFTLVPALLASAAPPKSFETFCFKCHDSVSADGELDLESFLPMKQGAMAARTLEEIATRLREHDMPPRKSKKQPTESERAEMLAWTGTQLDAIAKASEDDPGLVVMSRLTRGEYRNVIRDLSGGIVTKGGEYLPNEGGAGEGFSNVGEAQSMSAAQFVKYLEAAKGALRFLRVSPHDGLIWSALAHEPVDEPPAAIHEATDEIIAWHIGQQQKWGAQHRATLEAQFGNAHAVYLAAAKRDTDTPVCVWKGQAGVPVSLSPVALEKWQCILRSEDKASPFADWAKAWRALPTGLSNAKLLDACQAIVGGKLGAQMGDNKGDFAPPYEISFREAKDEVLAAARDEGRWPFRIDIGNAKELFLIMTDAGDGAAGEFGLWHRGRFVFKDGTSKAWQDAVRIIGANSGRDFPFGRDGANEATLEPDAVGQRPPGALKFAVPTDAIVFEVDFTLDKKRTKVASVQSLVLKEKPVSQSFVPGRFVFGGRDVSKAKGNPMTDSNKQREQLLRKRNVAEANETKTGLNAERNVFADWTRTSLEAIGGPWPTHSAEKAEPNAPYFYTVAEVRRNASPEDLAQLRLLEERLVALAESPPPPALEAKARGILAEFATRAWRRELNGEDESRLMRLYRGAAAQGVSFDSAMKVPLLTVLMSSDFVYHGASSVDANGSGEREATTVKLTSSELATRLSFFLWASIPDDELLRLANDDKLRDPAVLKAQAARMLKDPRARSLASDFAAQVWGFDDFENFNGPDEKRFPEFNAEMRRAMLDEVIATLNRVFMEDAPINRLLDEDCLATKALFLTKKSLPLRTSPVQRGAWVVEILLGRRIPPPPPNVPKLSEDEKSADGLNIQQQLAKHRADANCAACHAKIDPPGIALENFDPIGRWRDKERDGTPIVNTDAFADGTKLDSVNGLKRWLRSRKDEFATNLYRKLLGYALGRAVLPGDRALLERMKAQKSFSAAVLELVTSPQFTMRRIPSTP